MRPLLPHVGIAPESGVPPSSLPQNHSPPLLTSGNNPAYGAEDANEDTIGVLVRLITEKKGEEEVCLSLRPGKGGLLSEPARQPQGSDLPCTALLPAHRASLPSLT